ncbi:MAG: hypothetical protein AAF789_10600 [Bacteroidota bacterium]
MKKQKVNTKSTQQAYNRRKIILRLLPSNYGENTCIFAGVKNQSAL